MKLSNDQIEFQDLLRRFLKERVGAEYLQKRVKQEAAVDPALTAALAELGLDEGFQGKDAPFGVEEIGILANECGRVLLPDPLIERLIASALIPPLLEASEHSDWLTVAKEGSVVGVAFPAPCKISQDPSVANEQRTTVTGQVEWCIDVNGAQALLAFCATPDGLRACLVSLSEQGVRSSSENCLDLTLRLSKLELKGARATILSLASTKVIEDLLEAVYASHLAGLSQAVIEMTCEYVKTRQQFGAPIGSFQAVQQQIAQRYAEVEALDSLSRFAVWSAVKSKQQAGLTARAAILQATIVTPQTCEMAIQTHGGIGFTWEYPLHLYLRRARLYAAAFALTESRARELVGRI
jgi:alkylation response protein AidB-like acyl-CoA dehydrogenase